MQRIIGNRNMTAGRDIKINKSRTQEYRPQVYHVMRLQALQILFLMVLLVLMVTQTISNFHLQEELAEIRHIANAVHIKSILNNH
jgi:hypothetical protein